MESPTSLSPDGYNVTSSSSFSEDCRFQYVLAAATSIATKINEDTLTYLNQGQSYEIKLKKLGDLSHSRGKMLKVDLKLFCFCAFVAVEAFLSISTAPPPLVSVTAWRSLRLERQVSLSFHRYLRLSLVWHTQLYFVIFFVFCLVVSL